MNIPVLVLLVLVGYAKASTSCVGRCGDALDTSKPCQCNSACSRYNDCCSDYEQVCSGTGGGGGDLAALMEDLWANDVNRYQESEYTLNYQANVSDSNRQDQASEPLFTYVDESRFRSPTYKTFMFLLDNYNINVGQEDVISSTEWGEIESFLDAILATTVMQKAYTFLTVNGYIANNEANWRDLLKEMWFNLYPRSSSNQGILDSSGFEHVIVGEEKSSSIGGFHNWIQFYVEERAKRLDYTGLVSRAEPRTVGSQFIWNGKWKGLGSFLVGVSPEFDIAVYTVCSIVHTNSRCTFTLNNHQVRVQSYDISHKSGLQIATAYPIA